MPTKSSSLAEPTAGLKGTLLARQKSSRVKLVSSAQAVRNARDALKSAIAQHDYNRGAADQLAQSLADLAQHEASSGPVVLKSVIEPASAATAPAAPARGAGPAPATLTPAP